MEAIKNLDMIKEFIEKHQDEFDKEKLTEYGIGALTLLSGVVTPKIIRGIVIGVVIITAGKLAYDYFNKDNEVA